MAALRTALLALSLLATALAAGFFYAYSVSVMPGLDAAEPASAVRAMQGINAVVRTPVFAFAFFGALGFPLLAAAACAATGRRLAAALVLAAAAVYGLGVFAVTFVVHIPLNEALAAARPADAAAAAATWEDYTGRWTAWNHLRAAASAVALGPAAAALIAALRR
jgi:uncharacterized membrane protein